MHMLERKNEDIYNNHLSLIHNLVKEAVGTLTVITVHILTSHPNFKPTEKPIEKCIRLMKIKIQTLLLRCVSKLCLSDILLSLPPHSNI